MNNLTRFVWFFLAVSTGFCGTASAASDPVLSLVPDHPAAWFRLRNFEAVNKTIDDLISQTVPPEKQTRGFLIQLWNTLLPIPKASSPEQLKRFGFDLRSGLLIVFADAGMAEPLILARVGNEDAIINTLKNHKNYTSQHFGEADYWLSEGKAWALIGGWLCYSSLEMNVQKCLAASRNETAPLHASNRRTEWNWAWQSTSADTAGYLNLQLLLEKPLQEFSQAPENISNNAGFKLIGWLMKQGQGLSATAALNTSGLVFDTMLQFKENSPVLNFLEGRAQTFELGGSLPPNSALAFNLRLPGQKVLEAGAKLVLSMVPGHTPIPAETQKEALNRCQQEMARHLAAFEREIAIAISGERGVIPQFTVIQKIRDEKSAKTLMEGFVPRCNEWLKLFAGLAPAEAQNALAPLAPETTENYAGTTLHTVTLFKNLAGLLGLDDESIGMEAAFQPLGPWLKARRLIGSGAKSSWSPDGKKLVYGSVNNEGLRILDVESGKVTELTQTGKDPVWCPTGQWIAYVDCPNAGSPGEDYTAEVIFLAPENGGPARRLRLGGYPSWSGDGQRIFFQDRKSNQVLALNPHQPDVQPEVILDDCGSWYPAVSPDGKRIALWNDGALAIFERGGKKAIISAPRSKHRGILPSWSPDSRLVVYGGFDNDPGGLWIYDVAKDQRLRVAGGAYTLGAWSADGQKLAFDNRTGSTREIWMVQMDAVRQAPEAQVDDSDQSSLKFTYACQDNKFVAGIGLNNQPVKDTLDIINGRKSGLSKTRNFELAQTSLYPEANLAAYFSPLPYFRWENRLHQALPDDLFSSLKPGIGAGISLIERNRGFALRGFVSASELKQVAEFLRNR